MEGGRREGGGVVAVIGFWVVWVSSSLVVFFVFCMWF